MVWFQEGLVWGLVSGSVKTSGFALGFQHFPRDLANVNEWKIMFDPSIIIINKVPHHQCNDNIFFDRQVQPVVQTQIRLLLEEPSDLDNNTVLA